MHKFLIGMGVFFGSTIGSYIPVLWGASAFSVSSILFGVIGVIVGIFVGFYISKYLGFF
jgi:hypothetical protein